MKNLSVALLGAFALSACSPSTTIEQNGRKAVVKGKEMSLFKGDTRVAHIVNIDDHNILVEDAKMFINSGVTPIMPYESKSAWPFYGSRYACWKDLRSATSDYKISNHYELTFKTEQTLVQKYDGDIDAGKGNLKAREFCLTGKVLDLK